MLTAISAVALATAAIADTVVWYDFDGLDNAGTAVSHGTTSAYMPVSAIGYPAGRRIFEPASSTIATSADGAIKFTTPDSSTSNHGGALQTQEPLDELSSGTFTLEMIIRPDPNDGFVKSAAQTFVCKTISGTCLALPSCSGRRRSR